MRIKLQETDISTQAQKITNKEEMLELLKNIKMDK